MPHEAHPYAPRRLPLAAALLLSLLVPAPALAGEAAEATKAKNPLLIGTYPMTVEQVVDGDTLKLAKGQPAVRVLGIDCEEVFKKERDRKAAASDFAAYAQAKRGDHVRPRKYGTPAGEAAREFVKALVKDVKTIRLERDGPKAREKGTFGRVLAHVILVKEQGEVNLAEAVLRAGHSPYFTKYGRSLRMDARFREAERIAREARCGIWAAAGTAHYPDYPERVLWWNARADQIDRWRKLADKPGHVTLGAPDAMTKLKALVGKQATVFGLYERELPLKGDDKRVFLLSHERGLSFAFVFFDLEAAKALDVETMEAGYVTVRGTVTLYQDRPQMVLESATQITTK